MFQMGMSEMRKFRMGRGKVSGQVTATRMQNKTMTPYHSFSPGLLAVAHTAPWPGGPGRVLSLQCSEAPR